MIKKNKLPSWVYPLMICFSLVYTPLSYAVEPRADSQLELSEYEETASEIPVTSIQQFIDIYSLVKQNYVSDVTDEQLFDNAIQGLVKGLDPYSRYLSAKDYQDLVKYTEGDQATVDFDLYFSPLYGQWVIQHLRNNSDSYKQGLRNDMTVSKINDRHLIGLNQDQINELLLGSLGSQVKVQYGTTNRTVTLIRNQKYSAEVQSLLLQNNQVLVIRIPVFKQDTANEIKRILKEFEPYMVKAVLLDLRNNPGGLLSSAVETADLFLNQGLIVTTQSRSEGNQSFRALTDNILDNKLGVLINSKSASAAEVLTAALQYHKRAWIIGERSYGKGVVQKILPLENGDAVSLTVAHYYTPDGIQLEGKGVEPNLRYPLTADLSEREYIDQVAGLLLNHDTKK